MRLFIIIIYIYIIIQRRINCHLNTRQEEKEEGRKDEDRGEIERWKTGNWVGSWNFKERG